MEGRGEGEGHTHCFSTGSSCVMRLHMSGSCSIAMLLSAAVICGSLSALPMASRSITGPHVWMPFNRQHGQCSEPSSALGH